MNQRPALDRTPVAGLPVSVFGFQGEARINDEVERGFVLKADVNGMVLAGGKDLYKVYGLAIEFIEAVEGASAIAADGGLAALGLGEAQ